MKLEFNGREVFGFLLGGVCGVMLSVALGVGPVGRIQRERDEARATVETQRVQIQQLQFQVQAAAQKTADQSSPLELLNAVHPGLGTLAVAASKIKLPAGTQPPVVAQVVPNPILRCAADQIAVPALGQCVTCNPGLHPGQFPDGSVGCVQ
jgi:hypothetical protein